MVLVLNKILITISIRYPYYHELQLPTINDYYFSKSKLNVSNNDSIQMSEESKTDETDIIVQDESLLTKTKFVKEDYHKLNSNNDSLK